MKKRILVLLSVFLIVFCVPVFAKPYVGDYERTADNNYGNNKNWKIESSNKYNLMNTPYVDATKRIYDYAEVLSEKEEKELKALIDEFVESSNMDMVILTVDYAYSNDKENETLASDFYDYNDFGLNLNEKNSGVLLLRNNYSRDPYFNIYTFGNAQLYFSYDRLEHTLDNIYPDLKAKRHYVGFKEFIVEMQKYYDKGLPSESEGYYVDDEGFLHYHGKPAYQRYAIVSFVISLIFTIIFIAVNVNKNTMVTKATTAREYLFDKNMNINIKSEKFISTHTSSVNISSSSSSGGGHSHSSRGSSGGGHSSGGGRHG